MITAADVETRQLVLAALEGTSSSAVRNDPRIEGYLEGRLDLPLEELGMDSLDVMEFCIAIEVNSGVSIVTRDLEELGTLAGVADAIRTRRA